MHPPTNFDFPFIPLIEETPAEMQNNAFNGEADAGVGNKLDFYAAVDEEYEARRAELQAESLIPLKEDLSEWLQRILDIAITTETFMEALDNGAALCRLAHLIQLKAEEASREGKYAEHIPKLRFRCRENARSRTWYARDNAATFLRWCRDFGMNEGCMFESEDLVCHRQEKPVVVCLLELARLGYKFGLEPPCIIKIEKEIEREESELASQMNEDDVCSHIESDNPKDVGEEEEDGGEVNGDEEIDTDNVQPEINGEESEEEEAEGEEVNAECSDEEKEDEEKEGEEKVSDEEAKDEEENIEEEVNSEKEEEVEEAEAEITEETGEKEKEKEEKEDEKAGGEEEEESPKGPVNGIVVEDGGEADAVDDCSPSRETDQKEGETENTSQATNGNTPETEEVEVNGTNENEAEPESTPDTVHMKRILESPLRNEIGLLQNKKLLNSPRSRIDNLKARQLDKKVKSLASQHNVSDLVSQISEGKYCIFGRVVFIRLLKEKHLMVRVGGGWDTLEHYLSHHSPTKILEFKRNDQTKTPVTSPKNNTDFGDSPTLPSSSSVSDDKYLFISGKYRRN